MTGSKRERAAHLLDRITFGALLSLMVFVAIPYGSVEFWWASFFEIIVFAIAALWLVAVLLGGEYESWRWRWFVFPALALILFSWIQTIALPGSLRLSADPFETRSLAIKLAALTVLTLLLLRLTTTRTRLQALVFVVIGIGAASAVFGILRQTMQHSEVGFVLPALPRGIGYGQIISRNQFAFMMEMSLGVALGFILTRAGRYESNLLSLALAVPIVIALILANSRGGILTMMCQLVFAPLIVFRRTRSQNGKSNGMRRFGQLAGVGLRAISIVILVALASVAVVWVGGEPVVSNLSTVNDELSSQPEAARWNTRRVDIWRTTWGMIKAHPITGVGFAGYWIAVPQYHDASGAYTPQQAHNDYLEILASGGIIGAAICIWFAVQLIRQLKRTLVGADPWRRAVCAGASIGLLGVAVHSLFDFGLHLTINSVLFVALIVLGTAAINSQKVKRDTHAPV